MKIQAWLNQGYTEAEVARKWNGGTSEAKRGINKHGEAYDTELYARMVLSLL